MACTQVTTPDQETALVYEWYSYADLVAAIDALAHRRIDVFVPAAKRNAFATPGYIGTTDHIKENPNGTSLTAF